MEFAELLRKRRMVRAFTEAPIEDRVLNRVLDAGRRAGSAGNTHGTSVLVLSSKDHRDRFWECTGDIGNEPEFPWPELTKAPVVLLPLADAAAYRNRYAEPDKQSHVPDKDLWRIPFWYIDSGFAIQNILLAATNEGLGALFFGVFGNHVAALEHAFEIEPDREILGAIAIGHPSQSQRLSGSARRGRPDLASFANIPK